MFPDPSGLHSRVLSSWRSFWSILCPMSIPLFQPLSILRSWSTFLAERSLFGFVYLVSWFWFTSPSRMNLVFFITSPLSPDMVAHERLSSHLYMNNLHQLLHPCHHLKSVYFPSFKAGTGVRLTPISQNHAGSHPPPPPLVLFRFTVVTSRNPLPTPSSSLHSPLERCDGREVGYPKRKRN